MQLKDAPPSIVAMVARTSIEESHLSGYVIWALQEHTEDHRIAVLQGDMTAVAQDYRIAAWHESSGARLQDCSAT
eukprot:1161685-Pelagomonas_calceolata.AAC.18